MNFRKIFGTALTATILAGSLAGTAFANDEMTKGEIEIKQNEADKTFSVSIEGGDFGVGIYSFEDETYDGKFVVTVRDPRGTNAGWNVSISGGDFSSATDSFKVGNLKLVKASEVDAKIGKADGITTSAPLTMSSTAAPLLEATKGNGAGLFEVEFDATLTVPGLQTVGEYTSTITVDIVTAPVGDV